MFATLVIFAILSGYVSGDTCTTRTIRTCPTTTTSCTPTSTCNPTTVTVTASPGQPTVSLSQCNTGHAQCCNSVSAANDPSVTPLLDMLGVKISGGGQVGLTCSPITVVGTGSGASCDQQPVCCQNNNFAGIIAIGCVPINLNG